MAATSDEEHVVNAAATPVAESAAAVSPYESPATRVAPTDKSRVQYHATLFLLSLAVMVLAVVMRVPDEENVAFPVIDAPLPTLCAMRRLAGIDCPGCGLTRCFISLAHGLPGRAWHFNPVGLLLFAVVAAQIPFRAVQLWRIRRGKSEWNASRFNWLLLGIAAALIGQWIVRLVLHFVMGGGA
jgi:hypothetical protein